MFSEIIKMNYFITKFKIKNISKQKKEFIQKNSLFVNNRKY